VADQLALFEPRPPVEAGARMSACGHYRYALWRLWDFGLPSIVWVMLNPSTADATRDDPTIRRCVGFARRWGLGGVYVVNLFAWRATDPAEIRRRRASGHDVVGPENDAAIAEYSTERPVVAAWGAHGGLGDRDRQVIRLLHPASLFALSTTNEGYPRHPLYLPGDLALRPFPAGVRRG